MAKRAAHWAAGSAEKTVYFYRIDAGNEPGGQDRRFPTARVLKHLQALPFEDARVPGNGNDRQDACCWVDLVHGNEGRLRFGYVRRDGFPQLEQAGTLSPLDLPDDTGLVELIHLAFLPHNIVGAVFNFYGPRASRFAWYLQQVASSVCPPCRLTPLLRNDVAARLAQLHELRMLDLKVLPPFISEIERSYESLGAAFRAAQEAGRAQQIQVVLKPEPRSRQSALAPKLLSAVRSLARKARGGDGNVARFEVAGTVDGQRRLEKIDVLADELLVKKRIPLRGERTRALQDGPAFEAIAEAYSELKDELHHAAAIS